MNFPPSEVIQPGHLLLVTDELASPADFILHQAVDVRLQLAKKDPSTSGAIIVTSSGTEAGGRWKTIATKSGISPKTVSEYLEFVDIMSHSELMDSQTTSAVKTAFKQLSSVLTQSKNAGSLVILDDVSVLEWIGFDVVDVTRFIRAVAGLCRKNQSPLIVRYHVLSTPSGDPSFVEDASDDIFGLLLQLSSHHLEVRSLSSGRSGSVSGEIALHRGPSLSRSGVGAISIPRSCAVQYRLTDYSAVYFQRGTASGVL